MIAREDLDECPKCHDTGIHIQHQYNSQAVTSTAKFCDCPIAKNYLAQFRSIPALKSRIALIQRDYLERMAHLAQTPKNPNK
jgi:hypothetical protein